MPVRTNIHSQNDFMRGEGVITLIYTQISSMEESMIHRQKCNSQSGFMSVEAIATALFYLVMIGIVTLIASKVMNSGKMATATSSLSMLRSNLQYIGANAGDYSSIAQVTPSTLLPGLLTGTNAGKASLKTGHEITIRVADKSNNGDINEDATALASDEVAKQYFAIEIAKTNPEECRRIAYYAVGGGYGVKVDSNAIGPATRVTDIESNCGTDFSATVDIVLTSR